MLTSLLWTALLMGLAGGPHCVVMCAAPCALLTSAPVVHLPGQMPAARPGLAGKKLALFHSARLMAYAALGALAALGMQSLAWLGRQSVALQSAWALAHVAVMAWGLLMLAQARQPAWLEAAGRSSWARVQPWLAMPWASAAAGLAWGLMPCGLLYSALLVAALAGSGMHAALVMVVFGGGSALWLLAAPYLWRFGRQKLNAHRAAWGTRLAGLALAVMALHALWLHWAHQHQMALWCR